MFWDVCFHRLFISFNVRENFSFPGRQKAKQNGKMHWRKWKLCFICVNGVLCVFSPFLFSLGVWFMFYVLLNACLDIILQRAFYYDFLFWFGREKRKIYFHLYLLIFNPFCNARGGAKCMMYLGLRQFKLGESAKWQITYCLMIN